MDHIEERIKEILTKDLKTQISAEQINIENDLKDFGVDSVAFIKIIVKLETEFGIEFDDEDIDVNKFVTIRNLIEYVGNKAI